MEVNMCQVSERASEKNGDILQMFLHWAWAIPYMSYDVVQRLSHIGS